MGVCPVGPHVLLWTWRRHLTLSLPLFGEVGWSHSMVSWACYRPFSSCTNRARAWSRLLLISQIHFHEWGKNDMGVRQADESGFCCNAVEPRGKALCLLVNLHSNLSLWSWTVDSDQKIADTSGWNEFPPQGGWTPELLLLHIEIAGWSASGVWLGWPQDAALGSCFAHPTLLRARTQWVCSRASERLCKLADLGMRLCSKGKLEDVAGEKEVWTSFLKLLLLRLLKRCRSGRKK